MLTDKQKLKISLSMAAYITNIIYLGSKRVNVVHYARTEEYELMINDRQKVRFSIFTPIDQDYRLRKLSQLGLAKHFIYHGEASLEKLRTALGVKELIFEHGMSWKPLHAN